MNQPSVGTTLDVQSFINAQPLSRYQWRVVILCFLIVFLDGLDTAAMGFIDTLAQAYQHIGRHPATGSPRYAHELNLPGLRVWQLARYPHLVFYMERPDHIDVWRVLYGQRDIPAWMQVPDDVI